jgi:hypothetical protein
MSKFKVNTTHFEASSLSKTQTSDLLDELTDNMVFLLKKRDKIIKHMQSYDLHYRLVTIGKKFVIVIR